jgi:hypothetical protein
MTIAMKLQIMAESLSDVKNGGFFPHPFAIPLAGFSRRRSTL